MIDLTKKVPVRKWSLLLATGYDHPDIFETDPQRGHSGCVILTWHQDLSLRRAAQGRPQQMWVEVPWHEGTCVSHLRENARFPV